MPNSKTTKLYKAAKNAKLFMDFIEQEAKQEERDRIRKMIELIKRNPTYEHPVQAGSGYDESRLYNMLYNQALNDILEKLKD